MRLKLKIVCVLLLLLSLYSTAFAAQDKPITASPSVVPIVILDGTIMSFDVPPILIGGATLVPMRAIFEALGATITVWDPLTQTVTAVRNQTEIVYKIGNTYAIINGWKVDNKSPVAGMTKDYRTLVPLRMVSESLGANVSFDGTTKTITINSKKTSTFTETPASLSRYRMTLPYTTIVQDAPYLISYVRENHTPDSIVYFGDSITWGSYLGRKEIHQNLIAEVTGRSSYNLGVPGFTLNQMLPFMQYALQGVEKPNVVVQLEYFWDDRSVVQYSGLDNVLKTPVPDYSTALAYIREDIDRDDDVTVDRPYANYSEQPATLKEATIARSKNLFNPKLILDSQLSIKLNELSAFIATRPDQSFFLYMPPYLMSEVYKQTSVTPSQFNAYVDQIKRVFSDNPNVHFMDFNAEPEQWSTEDFIDWIHRSASGEKKYAKLMQKWLYEN
jgi:hypothetical protein